MKTTTVIGDHKEKNPPAPEEKLQDLAAEAEALFREAKQRERRRRLLVVAVVVSLLAAVLAIVSFVVTGKGRSALKPPHGILESSRSRTIVTGSFVTPHQPDGLALASNGTLYLIDPNRNQILHRLSSGKFQVVAGTGARGFSGDGRLAINARLSLSNMSGIVVAKNGTVYFSDTGNNRVREILPNGRIETAAGGGTDTVTQAPTSALNAGFCTDACVEPLAIGPDGDLYIGANAVYSLNSSGDVHRVVGESASAAATSNLPEVSGTLATQSDFTNVSRLAFDGRGDLVVVGGTNGGVFERTITGRLLYLETDILAKSYSWPLVQTPNGNVIVATAQQVGANGVLDPGAADSQASLDSPALDTARGVIVFGTLNKNASDAIFFDTEGLVISPNGTQFATVNTGTESPFEGLLIEQTGNRSKRLWKS